MKQEKRKRKPYSSAGKWKGPSLRLNFRRSEIKASVCGHNDWLEKKRGGQNNAQKSLKIYKKVSRCCTKRQPRCGQSNLREVERKTSDSQIVDLPTARHLAPRSRAT